MDRHVNIRAKSVKLLEEGLRMDLDDFRFGTGFLDLTPKAQWTKEKIYNLDFIKIKNLCIKGQYEDIFVKSLLSRIYKQFNKNHRILKKMGQGPE